MGQELMKLDSITTLMLNSPTTERERYVEAERRRQEFAIAYTELKTQMAIKLTVQLSQQVVISMVEMAEYIITLAPRISRLDPTYRDLMEQVCIDHFRMCYKNMSAIQEIGVRNIAHVVSLSLLVEPPLPPTPEPKVITGTYYAPPPPRKGFLARLFGL